MLNYTYIYIYIYIYYRHENNAGLEMVKYIFFTLYFGPLCVNFKRNILQNCISNRFLEYIVSWQVEIKLKIIPVFIYQSI